MIRAMNRAAIATAVRAALAQPLPFDSGAKFTAELIDALVLHLDRMAVEIEPTKTVSQDRYDLLELKYKTLLELLKYSDKAKT